MSQVRHEREVLLGVFVAAQLTGQLLRRELPPEMSPERFGVQSVIGALGPLTPTAPAERLGSKPCAAVSGFGNEVVATIEVGAQPADGTVTAAGEVWIPLLGDSELVRIDPTTNEVAERVAVGPGPFVLNEAFGDLWAPSFQGSDVRRIDLGS